MPDPKRYVNIGVDRSYFPELRSAKLEWQAEIGDTLSWSEFFRILLDKDLRHLPLSEAVILLKAKGEGRVEGGCATTFLPQPPDLVAPHGG